MFRGSYWSRGGAVATGVFYELVGMGSIKGQLSPVRPLVMVALFLVPVATMLAILRMIAWLRTKPAWSALLRRAIIYLSLLVVPALLIASIDVLYLVSKLLRLT